VKKACVACGKQIPSVALDCVFCGAKQPVPRSLDAATAEVPALQATAPRSPDAATAEIPALQATPLVEASAASASSATDPTLHGLKVDEAAPATFAQTRPTAAMQIISLPDVAASVAVAAPDRSSPSSPAGRAEQAVGTEPGEARVQGPTPSRGETGVSGSPPSGRVDAWLDDDQPWSGLARCIMGLGGLVMIALFYLPWHGVSSWQLLETLGGAEFVRQLFYLTGGVILLATAVLPLPFVFRATIGTVVAALPVLLGAGGVLDGWRGVVAGLAILGLPATHLLRSRAHGSQMARALVVAAVFSVGLLYVAPISSVLPIKYVFDMIASGSIGLAVMGIFILIPLVFAGLSLLGILGRDLTEVGVLLSVLILLWAPVVISLRGFMMEDWTQLYVALALLWASATSALSLAQLLSLAARRA
jgi:hypothetical protein